LYHLNLIGIPERCSWQRRRWISRCLQLCRNLWRAADRSDRPFVF